MREPDAIAASTIRQPRARPLILVIPPMRAAAGDRHASSGAGPGGHDGGVRVSGIEDVLVRFGRCCNPLPGERIAGFITRGRGVTVHSTSCLRVMESDPARRVDVVWDEAAVAPRSVKVEVVSRDQPGMLASISKVISTSGINIARAEVRTDGQEQAVRDFLQKVYHELRNLGLTAEERALNYAATNALQVGRIFESAIRFPAVS